MINEEVVPRGVCVRRGDVRCESWSDDAGFRPGPVERRRVRG